MKKGSLVVFTDKAIKESIGDTGEYMVKKIINTDTFKNTVVQLDNDEYYDMSWLKEI